LAEGSVEIVAPSDLDDDQDQTVWQPEETAWFLDHVSGDRLAALYELAAMRVCGGRSCAG
jgi:hypothetical protein